VTLRGRSLRWRLTVWYTAAVGALLVVLGAAAVALLDRALRANVDTSLASVARTVATTARAPAGVGGNLEAQLEALLGPRLALRFLQLLDPLGRPDPRLAPRLGTGLPLSPEALDHARAGRDTFETIRIDGRAVRLLTLPVVERGRVVQLVQAAAPLESVETARSRFLLVLLGLAPLALAGVAAGAWRLTGRALAPVDAMTGAARRITGENLSLRIDALESDDELGRLAAVLNDMLGRLERSFAAARQFGADAAHELRTPLTILKGEIGVALRTAGTPTEYRAALESCREEVDRLTALVEDLLFVARAEAGAVERPAGPVDLGMVLDDAEPALRTLAEREGVVLALGPRPPAPVGGSEPMLFRLVLNLADNAIKYAGRGGHVAVTLDAANGHAVLAVRDDGPGIAAADLPHIFDRFYRADPARARGGTGLGLALVRSIVEVHGGRIDVDSAPGRGSCFRVALPLAPA
jgi:heavy metal sensor kinase